MPGYTPLGTYSVTLTASDSASELSHSLGMTAVIRCVVENRTSKGRRRKGIRGVAPTLDDLSEYIEGSKIVHQGRPFQRINEFREFPHCLNSKAGEQHLQLL